MPGRPGTRPPSVKPPSERGRAVARRGVLSSSSGAAASGARGASAREPRGPRRLGLSDDLTFVSSIAYYALLSIFPLLLLLFSLLGRLTGDPADRAALADLLLHYFPRRVEFITTQLNEVQGAGIGLSVAGTVVLCWTAMGAFARSVRLSITRGTSSDGAVFFATRYQHF